MYSQNYQEYVGRVKTVVEQSQTDLGDDDNEEMKEDLWTWFDLYISLSRSGHVTLKQTITKYFYWELAYS